MPDLILRELDAELLTTEITDRVIAALTQVLTETAEPRMVDGDRMAELAGLSRPSIDRAVRDKIIPSVKVGRRRLFQAEKVIAAFAAHSEKGAADA